MKKNLSNTAYRIDFLLTIRRRNANGETLTIVPILSLAWLIMLRWNMRRGPAIVKFWLYEMRRNVGHKLLVASKLLAIAFSISAFAMGVKL